jgi:hypothetical protein
MKIIYDYDEFHNRTKPICDHFDLDHIEPDSLIGHFFPSRLHELTQYCIDHPQYHIMSILPKQVKVNRPVEAARCYLLAEGDKDPDLWLSPPFNQESFESLQIYKFDCS